MFSYPYPSFLILLAILSNTCFYFYVNMSSIHVSWSFTNQANPVLSHPVIPGWWIRIPWFQYIHRYTGWWFQPLLKNISQNGNLPQIGLKIKNLWNHQLVYQPNSTQLTCPAPAVCDGKAAIVRLDPPPTGHPAKCHGKLHRKMRNVYIGCVCMVSYHPSNSRNSNLK